MTTTAMMTEPVGAQPRLHFAADVEQTLSGQIISLADLKRSLRRSNADENARFIRESIRDKEIRVGIRAKF